MSAESPENVDDAHSSHSSSGIPFLNSINKWKSKKQQKQPMHSAEAINPIKDAGSDSKLFAGDIKGGSRADESVRIAELSQELQRMGLEPIGLERFIKYFHKFAVASGVSAEDLVILVKEIVELAGAGGKDGSVSVAKVQKVVEELGNRSRVLRNEVDSITKKKESLEVEFRLKELDYSAIKESIADFSTVNDQLVKHGISIKEDLPRLIEVVQLCKERLGHASLADVSELVSDLESIQDRKSRIELEITVLEDSKKELEGNLAALEDHIANSQHIVSSIEGVRKMGIDVQELEALKRTIRKIEEIQHIDTPSAQSKFFSDMDAYYRNSQALQDKLSVLRSLVQEKSQEFAELESDYLNSKKILDFIKYLRSIEIDENGLEQLQKIMQPYGTNLSSLAREFENQQHMKTRIVELEEMNRSLEDEQKSMHEKLVVLAKQQRFEDNSSSDRIRMEGLRQGKNSQEKKEAAMHVGDSNSKLKVVDSSKTTSNENSSSTIQDTIYAICKTMNEKSPVRIALEHALLAMKYEESRRQAKMQ